MEKAIIYLLLAVIGLGQGVNWNGNNWAFRCDWNGGDMGNAQIPGEECGGRCANTPGCTHFTWTTWNGGTCWMKNGQVSPNDARDTSDSSMVCGYIQGTDGGSSGGTQSGKTTRYWDCCKPSCSWPGKANVNSPVRSCAANGATVLGANDMNSCDGGTAYTCNNNIPWAIDDNLAYGFAAAKLVGQGEGDWCCACYELTFTSTAVSGKKMIVQVTNTGGDLGSNHFDLQIPGGGVGWFTRGCKSQWNAGDNGWGDRYGGVASEADCQQVPEVIRNGCLWRFRWFKNADNPTMNFRKVNCPSELTSRTGCNRV